MMNENDIDFFLNENLIENKLLKQQSPAYKKNIDISNSSITVKSHNDKNTLNKKVKLTKEISNSRESIKTKLSRIQNINKTKSLTKKIERSR